MANPLLKLLFEDSPEQDKLESYLLQLDEEMKELEGLEVKKAPLEKALKSIEVPKGELTMDPSCYVMRYDNARDYRRAVELLHSPDGMHALAELGWLAAVGGEVTQDKGEFTVSFIPVTGDEEPSDEEKTPDLEKSDAKDIAKDCLDFVNEPLADREDIKATDSDKGVGKAKSGSDPEGKPKGSNKKNESVFAEASVVLQERLNRRK
jgi:hypothetical protein